MYILLIKLNISYYSYLWLKKAIKIKIFYIKSASFNNQTHIFLIIISYFKKKNGMLYLFMITKVLKYDLNFSDGHKIWVFK